MGKANNTSRSLIIASKLQGFDPTKIDGAHFAGADYPENRPTQGDMPYLTGPLPPDPEYPCPDPAPGGPDTRSPGPGGKSSGKHDPYGGGKSEAGA